MACFPHTPLGTPHRRFAVATSSKPKIKSRRGYDPDLRSFHRSADAYVKVSRVLAAGGRDKRAMDGARPSKDMDVLPRGKRPPADRARPPTGALEFAENLIVLDAHIRRTRPRRVFPPTTTPHRAHGV